MDIERNTCTVRGNTIFFGPDIINRLYGLPSPEDVEFQRFLNPPDMDVICRHQKLCPFGMGHADPNGKRVWFQQRNLSAMAKCRIKKSIRSLYYRSTITKLISIYENALPVDIATFMPSNMGLSTLRALGPNDAEAPHPPPQNHQPPAWLTNLHAQLGRIEENMDNMSMQQLQMRDELATIHTMQTELLFYSTSTIR
ncbi:hypothetical protein HAX54_012623 [Datura stramonium]|uniref:Uncharacterized protein n=1 Tax=Datura stramonium TaxID=4076 RepID=A0ABS8RXV2_DATST|nr:hypothetical protein [Datura stramonium]